MDDRFNELIEVLVRPLPETAMGLLCKCLESVLPHTHYVIRLSPLCGVKVLPAQKLANLISSRCNRQKTRAWDLSYLYAGRGGRILKQESREEEAGGGWGGRKDVVGVA